MAAAEELDGARTEAAKVLCEQVESVAEMQWAVVTVEVAAVLCEAAEWVVALASDAISVWE
jgi:hypothetical protein